MDILFLAISLFWAGATVPSQQPELQKTELATDQQDRVIVYYFHTNVRCPTCRKIEKLTHEIITGQFQQELASGRLVWRMVNTDLPENRHFIDQYQLITKSVVLSREVRGKEQEYLNLPKVWELIGSDDQYRAYIRSEVGRFLGM